MKVVFSHCHTFVFKVSFEDTFVDLSASLFLDKEVAVDEGSDQDEEKHSKEDDHSESYHTDAFVFAGVDRLQRVAVVVDLGTACGELGDSEAHLLLFDVVSSVETLEEHITKTEDLDGVTALSVAVGVSRFAGRRPRVRRGLR